MTVHDKLRDRCVDMLTALSLRNQEPASAVRWEKKVDDLHAFVLSEIGRAASDKLADSSALVLFFASPEGAEEVAKAIQEAMPGLIEKKWPS